MVVRTPFGPSLEILDLAANLTRGRSPVLANRAPVHRIRLSITKIQLPSSMTSIPACLAASLACRSSAPGCIQIVLTPIAIACLTTSRVTSGGVTIERACGTTGRESKSVA